MSTISILTDFGTKDWYVGVMKGVMYDIYPGARMVDITHEISNHSVEQAAFVLASSYSYFSYGSIHVAVVDPGVGGTRAPILLESRGHYFIGPDNGLFTLVDHPESKVYVLDKKEYQLRNVSATFHGRDIFAPAGAYLARGVPSDQLGTLRKEKIVKLDIAKPQQEADGSVRGRVICVDRFGNCVTNIPKGSVAAEPRKRVQVQAGKQVIECLAAGNYAQEAGADPMILSGSSGFLELSINKAPFGERYGIREGDPVTLRFGK